MPRIDIRRMLPPPDYREDELVELARAHGFNVSIDNKSRLAGLPYLRLFKKGSPYGTPPVVVFAKAAAGIRWLEEGRQFASPT